MNQLLSESAAMLLVEVGTPGVRCKCGVLCIERDGVLHSAVKVMDEQGMQREPLKAGGKKAVQEFGVHRCER